MRSEYTTDRRAEPSRNEVFASKLQVLPKPKTPTTLHCKAQATITKSAKPLRNFRMCLLCKVAHPPHMKFPFILTHPPHTNVFPKPRPPHNLFPYRRSFIRLSSVGKAASVAFIHSRPTIHFLFQSESKLSL